MRISFTFISSHSFSNCNEASASSIRLILMDCFKLKFRRYMIDSQRRSPDDKSRYSALRPLALSQVVCSQEQKQTFDLSLILVLCIPCLGEQSEEIFACLLVWQATLSAITFAQPRMLQPYFFIIQATSSILCTHDTTSRNHILPTLPLM
jgi:hypothetical protein